MIIVVELDNLLFLHTPHTHMQKSKHTILYAEDDMDDLFIVKQAFEKHDHIEVLHASNGKEAIVQLEAMIRNDYFPCLVILDINMPIMNGKEALQAIRKHQQLQKLSVVLFSTSNSVKDAEFAKNNNAELVTKPIEFGDLEEIARQFVNQCDFEINKLTIPQ